MPRARRLKSETGIYHVVLRGINKQTIFEDDEDNEMFMLTLNQYKQKSGYKLLAYCLMGNHVHLLKIKKRSLKNSKVLMKKLNSTILMILARYLC